MSMSNEEAIFVLQEALNDIEPLSYGTAKPTQIALRKEAMRTAIAALRNQPRWIPCRERLPEYGIEVVSVDKDGEYEINHIIDEEDGEWFWQKVTAWMSLPPAYKGGKE